MPPKKRSAVGRGGQGSETGAAAKRVCSSEAQQSGLVAAGSPVQETSRRRSSRAAGVDPELGKRAADDAVEAAETKLGGGGRKKQKKGRAKPADRRKTGGGGGAGWGKGGGGEGEAKTGEKAGAACCLEADT
jgi:hypothetical protein